MVVSGHIISSIHIFVTFILNSITSLYNKTPARTPALICQFSPSEANTYLDSPQHPVISDININTAGVCILHKSNNTPQSMWTWPKRNPQFHFHFISFCRNPSPISPGHLPTIIGYSRLTHRMTYCKQLL